MKRYFLLTSILFSPLFSFAIFSPEEKEKKPKIIVFIDINKTAIATDQVNGKLPEQTLQTDIAEKIIVYKKEDEISLFPQEEFKPITYYKWIKKNYPTVEEQKEPFLNTLSFLKKMNHPKYEEMQRSYDKSLSILNKHFKDNQLDVFPSVINLIKFACHEKIAGKVDIYIVFRTFGVEGNLVASQLNQYFGEALVDQVHTINYEGKIEGSDLNPLEFTLEQNKRILVIQDNYPRWNDHGKVSAFGKPCPVQTGIHVKFFDDNAHADLDFPEKGIVDVTVDGKSITTKEAIDAKIVVPISLADIIQDENFFIKHVIEKNILPAK